MTSEEKRQRHKEGHRSRVEAARVAQARGARRQRLILLSGLALFVVAVVVAAVVLLGGDDDSTATDETTTTAAASTTATTTGEPAATTDPTAGCSPATGAGAATAPLTDPPVGCALTSASACPPAEGVATRVAQFTAAPPTCVKPDEALEAVIETSDGTITATLDSAAAPTMVNNFVVLARYKYFDGLPFHRLMPDFVAQTGSSGIPNYGSGGPGYDMPDTEKPTDGYAPGDLAMARSDAVSGSQFFIVASEAGAAQLTNEYPRFGKVTEGLELVTAMAEKGDAAANGTPTELVTITSVTIRPAGG